MERGSRTITGDLSGHLSGRVEAGTQDLTDMYYNTHQLIPGAQMHRREFPCRKQDRKCTHNVKIRQVVSSFVMEKHCVFYEISTKF